VLIDYEHRAVSHGENRASPESVHCRSLQCPARARAG